VIRELREFCEDNNVEPPAPMKSVPVRPELSYWSGSDPALDIEADPAVQMRADSGRTCYLQRVIYEIRYSLYLENGQEFERGYCQVLDTAFVIARIWLGGGGMSDLPKERRYWL
jgi:hypothetical protein